jgi:hypothetical protein
VGDAKNKGESYEILQGLKDLKGLRNKLLTAKYLRGLKDLKGLREAILWVGGFFTRSC